MPTGSLLMSLNPLPRPAGIPKDSIILVRDVQRGSVISEHWAILIFNRIFILDALIIFDYKLKVNICPPVSLTYPQHPLGTLSSHPLAGWLTGWIVEKLVWARDLCISRSTLLFCLLFYFLLSYCFTISFLSYLFLFPPLLPWFSLGFLFPPT